MTVADIQVYLKLYCRCRACAEIFPQVMAAHYEQASEAAAFVRLGDLIAT